MSEELTLLCTLLGLLLLSGFFSGSETALFSIPALRLREMSRSSHAAERAVARIMGRPRKVLVTILIGNMVVNVLASALGTAAAIRILPSAGVGVAVATVVMTFLVLVAGEIAPKTLAYRYAESISRVVARPLLLLGRLLTPARWPLLKLTDLVLGRERRPEERVELAEVEAMLRMAHREGEVETHERNIIRGVIELGSSTVGDAMTPRTEIVALEPGMDLNSARARARESGFSKMPVAAADPDEMEGFVTAMDLLFAPETARLNTMTREALYVPEVKPALDVLEHFRQTGDRLAFVVDEHGHLSGIVTLTDLLEEISGEMVERSDLHKVFYERVNDRKVRIPGRMEIRFFNEEFRCEVEAESAETMAGLVLEKTGRIPSVGESFTIESLQVKVLGAEPHRIVKLEVTLPAKDAGGEAP